MEAGQLELVGESVADHGKDGATVELSHDVTFQSRRGACGSQGMEAEMGPTWVEVVGSRFDDDFVGCQPAAIDDEGNVGILFNVVLLG